VPAFHYIKNIFAELADVSNPGSTISTIDDLNAYQYLAGGVGSEGATGGMETKFEAARLATALGVQTWIAHGRADGVIHEAIAGQAGTPQTGLPTVS
jgi:glutamate 5-kinase